MTYSVSSKYYPKISKSIPDHVYSYCMNSLAWRMMHLHASSDSSNPPFANFALDELQMVKSMLSSELSLISKEMMRR
jgi:hypothetical protein